VLRLEHLADVLDQRRIHARRRLVEHDEPGFADEDHREASGGANRRQA
jgi:hypothetical protein